MNALRARLAAGAWPLLPLRLLIGYGFAAHGYAKLARGPAHFAAILAAIGETSILPLCSKLPFAAGDVPE